MSGPWKGRLFGTQVGLQYGGVVEDLGIRVLSFTGFRTYVVKRRMSA